MKVSVVNELTGFAEMVALPPGKNPVRIGSDLRNDVVLRSNSVKAQAAAILNEGRGAGWQLLPLAEGCEIDEDSLEENQPFPLKNKQVVKFFPFTLTIYLDLADGLKTEKERTHARDERGGSVINDIHRRLLESFSKEFGEAREEIPVGDTEILKLEDRIGEIASSFPELPANDHVGTDLGDHLAGQAVRAAILRQLMSITPGEAERQEARAAPWSAARAVRPELEKELVSVVRSIGAELDLEKAEDLSVQVRRLEQDFWRVWRRMAKELDFEFRRYLCLQQIRKDIKDIYFGLGPLEDLLEDPTITEIMVNDQNHIFVEKHGIIENSGRRFVKDLLDILQRIVARVHRKLDTSTPMVDARLSDGSRVNAVIPPLAVKGPCLTIRRFPVRPLDVDALLRMGTITSAARDFLRAAVELRSNILVAGGTGTGKTTLLNILSAFIPDKERIVTIEDTAELRLAKAHVVSLETRPANVEGKGAIDIRSLVKNSLRMRPDRIIVGECRGGEALDMLQAMNTGHDGSMTTIHANNPADVVLRLEVMVQQNPDTKLPVDSIHRQVASALDLIVQLQADLVPDPSRQGQRVRRRVVSEIVEVVDVDPDAGGLVLRPLFSRRADGKLRPTGCLPTFIDELVDSGAFDLDAFLTFDSGDAA